MVTSAPQDWQKTFCKKKKKKKEKNVLDCMYFPFIKITYILSLPTTSLEQFLKSYLGCCLPGYSSHFIPNKT